VPVEERLLRLSPIRFSGTGRREVYPYRALGCRRDTFQQISDTPIAVRRGMKKSSMRYPTPTLRTSTVRCAEYGSRERRNVSEAVDPKALCSVECSPYHPCVRLPLPPFCRGRKSQAVVFASRPDDDHECDPLRKVPVNLNSHLFRCTEARWFSVGLCLDESTCIKVTTVRQQFFIDRP
jgi:hypothetical protein